MPRDPVSEAASLFGAMGGKAGTGKAKKRSRAHYRRMVKIRLAKAKRKDA